MCNTSISNEHATLLDIARKAYLGEHVDKWEGTETQVASLVNYMKKAIEQKYEKIEK